MALSEDDFRSALSSWASGVSVVTVRSGTQVHGMTVSSFASVSLSSRLVSVCLDDQSTTLRLLRESGCFAINVLADDQASISNHFASVATENDRFDGIRWSEAGNGAPLIEGALTQFECRSCAQYAAGDHYLIIGEVTRTHLHGGAPLLYASRSYGGFVAASRGG